LGEEMNLRLKYDATPENAAALADEIVRTAKNVDGVTLDYTERSVAKIDRIIEAFRRENVQLASIAETLFCAGCYIGEVFVRNGRGFWRKTEDTGMKGFASAPMVIQTGPESACNPIDKVFKRMENGEEDSLAYFYSGFAQRGSEKRPWWKFWQ